MGLEYSSMAHKPTGISPLYSSWKNAGCTVRHRLVSCHLIITAKWKAYAKILPNILIKYVPTNHSLNVRVHDEIPTKVYQKISTYVFYGLIASTTVAFLGNRRTNSSSERRTRGGSDFIRYCIVGVHNTGKTRPQQCGACSNCIQLPLTHFFWRCWFKSCRTRSWFCCGF